MEQYLSSLRAKLEKLWETSLMLYKQIEDIQSEVSELEKQLYFINKDVVKKGSVEEIAKALKLLRGNSSLK